MTSHNQADVKYRYCAVCRTYHDLDSAIDKDLEVGHPDGPLRKRLPQRRLSVSFDFEHQWDNGQVFSYRATVGYYDNGPMGELFLNSSKRLGTALDANARDAAIFVSIALQYGAPLEILRGAQARNSDGYPSSPVGMALDEIIKRELDNFFDTPKTNGGDDSSQQPKQEPQSDREPNKS